MRLLVSGDKHLGLVSDGMERLDEQARILERTVTLLRAERPDVFVDLGDLFHSPRPGPAAYELALEYLCQVSEWAAENAGRAFFMTGNHDKATRGDVHALRPLKTVGEYLRRSSVEVVDEPYVAEVGDLDLMFLPHWTEWEARETSRGALGAEEYLTGFAEDALADSGKPIVAFAHLEVPGARMSNDETVQRDTGLAIPKEVLRDERVIRVYAGHVHKYQELERVTVVGSAIYVDFGEAADPKGMICAEVKP